MYTLVLYSGLRAFLQIPLHSSSLVSHLFIKLSRKRLALLTACHFAESRIILIPVDIVVDIETLMFCTCRYTCALRITFSSEYISNRGSDSQSYVSQPEITN